MSSTLESFVRHSARCFRELSDPDKQGRIPCSQNSENIPYYTTEIAECVTPLPVRHVRPLRLLEIMIPEGWLGTMRKIEGAKTSFFSPRRERNGSEAVLAASQCPRNQAEKAICQGHAGGFGSPWEIWDTAGAQNYALAEEMP